jgi:hypothetical protein
MGSSIEDEIYSFNSVLYDLCSQRVVEIHNNSTEFGSVKGILLLAGQKNKYKETYAHEQAIEKIKTIFKKINSVVDIYTLRQQHLNFGRDSKIRMGDDFTKLLDLENIDFYSTTSSILILPKNIPLKKYMESFRKNFIVEVEMAGMDAGYLEVVPKTYIENDKIVIEYPIHGSYIFKEIFDMTNAITEDVIKDNSDKAKKIKTILNNTNIKILKDMVDKVKNYHLYSEISLEIDDLEDLTLKVVLTKNELLEQTKKGHFTTLSILLVDTRGDMLGGGVSANIIRRQHQITLLDMVEKINKTLN